MIADTVELTACINACFDLAMDGRLSPSDRKSFLAVGKRLRGSLVNILSARFEDGTQQVIDANTKIEQVSHDLAALNANLDEIAEVLRNTAELVGVVDDLLRIAVSFM